MISRSRTLPSRIHHGILEENRDMRQYLQIETRPKPKPSNDDTEAMVVPQPTYSKCFDDDGRLKRTGTVWTAASHIITAVIGSGVLSLAWAVAQLGWVAGPIVMVLFALVTLYTSNLLSQCYRCGDPATGKRNYTYMDAVKANLGGRRVAICGIIQYINLFGVAIGYTIAASTSMMAIKKTSCSYKSKGKDPCKMSPNWYMIGFGIMEVILSQIPDFDQLWWLSIVAAIMSFTYSAIGLGLGITKSAENGSFKGSLTGVSIGDDITPMKKMWRSVQALGAVAFAYSFSVILIEIQDTVKSPPAEHKTMRKATSISIAVTTLFYMLCGCMGYAAFGDHAPGNILTDFGYFSAYWILDIANVAIVVHLIGAYQVYCQPLFAFVEKWSEKKWPRSDFVVNEYTISIPFCGTSYQLNLFRLVWRTIFVILTTVIAMLLPFFNDVVGILGALGFWPLTVYFPVEMYLAEKKIGRWTSRWLGLQILNVSCLSITLVALCGSVAGVLNDLKTYKPFWV
ncbi:amino acid permease 4-like [Telopea speciosissima]|uniref:amino acid permease 4-like n=1 Tax=Telopea speciosissima TaxID=54955 RepID=UPI001CC3F8A0|nr:amino acid permease 4-like [Telopea speciosissima]